LISVSGKRLCRPEGIDPGSFCGSER